jgi:hypothetical protein
MREEKITLQEEKKERKKCDSRHFYENRSPNVDFSRFTHLIYDCDGLKTLMIHFLLLTKLVKCIKINEINEINSIFFLDASLNVLLRFQLY